jgi:DNA-binding transcriptional LysR family regulator
MVVDVHGRDLRYFVAAAEELHFTRAAERLFISQPALSKQIRVLERQLGAPLFDRGREGVRLTPVSEALLPHARGVLAAWDRGWAEAERAKSRQRATLVAGMSTSPGRGGLPAGDQVPVHRPASGRSRGAPASQLGRLDRRARRRHRRRGLRLAPAARPRPLPADRGSRRTGLVAIPDSHPLASRDVIDVADLLDEPFLALPPAAGPLRDYWLAVDARDGSHRGSAPRSPAPTRPTRHSSTGAASA